MLLSDGMSKAEIEVTKHVNYLIPRIAGTPVAREAFNALVGRLWQLPAPQAVHHLLIALEYPEYRPRYPADHGNANDERYSEGLRRNRERTYSGCPVLTLVTEIALYPDHEAAFPQRGASRRFRLARARKRGFWLDPAIACTTRRCCFMDQHDVYAKNVDDFYDRRDQIHCYLSHKAGTAYIGRVEHAGESQQLRYSLLPDLHELSDIQLNELAYVDALFCHLSVLHAFRNPSG